ncbi:MAG TPA: DJ-1 family glyoxalase III [Candidatus Acidoferrales bacterium]|nr:DJ-1 family glyoxalase III [Candidatus Acidoferrales bacterium]
MNAVVLLAPGFEELETVAIVDVLRRASISVRLAGIAASPVEGGHGIKIVTDASIDDVKTYDALILPGGNPGYLNLERDQRVLKLIREAYAAGKYVAAICAAPHVLGVAGIMEGVTATCYPGIEIPGARRVERRVVHDGKIITSQGPGTAIDFAIDLVELLTTKGNALEVRKALLA